MEVEGKTILQTTERTELTGKEGIPFQEGTQNGHMLLEKIKEYISSDVYICPGAFQTTEEWSTTDVESIVGNWDEFTKSVSDGKIIIVTIQGFGDFARGVASIMEAGDNSVLMGYGAGSIYCIYHITKSTIKLIRGLAFLDESSTVDDLNDLSSILPLSANQGRILNEKISEISNPASAEQDRLHSGKHIEYTGKGRLRFGINVREVCG